VPILFIQLVQKALKDHHGSQSKKRYYILKIANDMIVKKIVIETIKNHLK